MEIASTRHLESTHKTHPEADDTRSARPYLALITKPSSERRSMSFQTTLIINLGVLAAVLFSDLGRRAVTWHRLARPLLLSIAIVPSFVHTLSTHGNDLVLQLAGTAAGVLVGLLAVSAMKVDHSGPSGTPSTEAGVGYALVWTVIAAGRLVFAYGSQHWFGATVAREAIKLHVTGTGITNALVFMAIAAVITRTLAVWTRVSRDRALTGGAPIPSRDQRVRGAQIA